MRWLKFFSLVLMLVLMAGCAGDNLEKMIPADATGVVSIDVHDILKKAGMLDDGSVVTNMPEVGVSVTLDWKPGGEYHPEL